VCVAQYVLPTTQLQLKCRSVCCCRVYFIFPVVLLFFLQLFPLCFFFLGVVSQPFCCCTSCCCSCCCCWLQLISILKYNICNCLIALLNTIFTLILFAFAYMCFIYVRTEKNKQIVSTSYEKTPVRHAKHNNNVLTAVKSIFDNRRRRRPMKSNAAKKKHCCPIQPFSDKSVHFLRDKIDFNTTKLGLF